jgi:hypothetical protein
MTTEGRAERSIGSLRTLDVEKSMKRIWTTVSLACHERALQTANSSAGAPDLRGDTVGRV